MKWVPAQFRKEVRLRVRPLRDRQVHDARLASWVLLGAVMAVLLIACANVANLMLARAATRQREMSVRVALGAGRARLMRQALTESSTLAMAGGVVGCGLAYALVRLFVAIAPQGIPRLEQASLDLRVLGFTFAAAVLSGVLFGLAPALERPRADAIAGWRSIGARRSLFRQIMAAAQIAISLVLLTGASLLLRSLWKLQNTPLGMRPDSVITANVVPGQGMRPEQRLAFFEELERRLERLPGVAAMAISDSVPPGGMVRARPFASFQPEGRPRFMEGTGGMVAWRFVTPGYFAAMGIPLVKGHTFRDEDRDPKRLRWC